ncbi:MAG: class I SAM-dependent DNA methyltransferase [Myxococcota bacterium]
MADAPDPNQKFDGYAEDYDRLLEDSIRASGESKEYFLDYKLACLRRLNVDFTRPLLDYGCGVGNLTHKLAPHFSEVEGYDPSPESLLQARKQSPQLKFHADPNELADGKFSTAVLSGVLHHVPPADRVNVMATVRKKLAPGGKVVIFEHNPWNPVTRKAVADCAFDDDAILLWPGELKRLLRTAGYADVRLEYIVFFPRPLAMLRPLEPRLNWLFMGAQTMTVGSQAV